jgi:shikimate dehydrogenase
MMNGLLGKKLGHSFSPAVHRAFGNPDYRLFETNRVESFLRNETFRAINVTVPYKEKVIPFLDSLDEIAKRTGSVNLILRTEAGLKGYNTDYFGFSALLDRNRISLKGKKVVILGNGGAAKTVAAVAEDRGCSSWTKLVRKKRSPGELLFSDAERVSDGDVLINATPVGMFPDNDGMPPVPPEIFPHLSQVIDLIYNPLETRFLQAFRLQGIPTVNGLFMLVAQARKSHELSFGTRLTDDAVGKIAVDLEERVMNLVLIGLPLSGKTLLASLLADRFHKIPVDTDAMIEKESQMPIHEIFRMNGEPFFRNLEIDAIEKIYRLGNQVISTGGGMIENPDIMSKLKQNGLILFLDKDPREIMKLRIDNRPLIQSPEDILRLDEKRRPLYLKYADLHIDANRSPEENLEEIEVKIHEYLHH